MKFFFTIALLSLCASTFAEVSPIPGSREAIAKVISDEKLMESIHDELSHPGSAAHLSNVSVGEFSGNRFEIKLTYLNYDKTCIVDLSFIGENYDESMVRSTTCTERLWR